MARVIGIDPGTVSFDLCGLEDDRVFLDRSLPAAEVTADPESLVGLLTAAMPLDLIAGPSGYGLPLVPIKHLTEREIFLAYLPRDAGETGGIGGLRRVVDALRSADLPVVFTPGVVHLPSVPAHRKANRLDMGTADKVCAAALAIEDQATHLGVEYEETCFVLAELGGAFTAVLAVEGGRIVDGQGGSSGPMGYRALGAMDGELAYLLGKFSKGALFSGGAAYLAGSPEAAPEELGRRTDRAAREAREALVEAVVKAVAAERVLVPGAREILLSGRLARVGWVESRMRDALSQFGTVRTVSGFARVAKEAAQGAALLADGLAGGRRRRLVETMEIRGASGTVFDYLHVAGAETLQQELARRAGSS